MDVDAADADRVVSPDEEGQRRSSHAMSGFEIGR